MGAVLVSSVVGLGLSGAVLVAAPRAGPAVDAARPRAHEQLRAPYRDGPPVGFAGGFGEDTCQACHFDGEVNQAPGSVGLEGVPERYAAGETYLLRVTLSRPHMVAAGFMLTARLDAGGGQAGTLRAEPRDEPDVAISADSQTGVLYAHQRATSSSAREASTSWTVLWTAPEVAASDVLLHVSALAADGDDSASGDFVFTTGARASAR